MGPLGRIAVVSMVLLVAGLAIGQSPNGPPDYQLLKGAEGIPPQNCWTCHKPGEYDPPMEPYIVVAPELTELPEAGVLDFNTVISSVWIGQENGAQEMFGFRATMDISDAPSFSFISDREPYGPETETGVITYEQGTFDIVGQSLPVDPAGPTKMQKGFVVVQVPDGATSATIRIIPDDQNVQTGPDLRVDYYPGFTEPSGDPFNDEPVDDAGKGGVEVIELTGSDFAATGYGNWTIEAGYIPVNTGTNDVTPFVQDVGFSVEVEASFDASDATQITQVDDSTILGGESLIMPWTLQVGDPQPGEVLRITLNFTIHYEHQAQEEPDNWRDLTEFFEILSLIHI